MDNLIKIRGEFLNEHEAEATVEKISPHCYNLKILYNDSHEPASYFDSFEPNFYDYNIMSGINTGWSLNPFGSYNFEHTRSRNYFSSLGLGRDAGKTIIEADVSREKYELVKERLYSHGALSVN